MTGSMAPSTVGRCMRGTLTSALFLLSCWALPDPRQVGGPAGPWCWGSPGAGNPDSSGAQGWVPWGVKGRLTALGQRGRKSELGVQGTIGLPGDGVGLSAVRPMLRADAVPATPLRPGPLSCPSACSPHFPSLTRLLASLLPHASSALDRGMRDSTGGWPSGTASSPKISLSFLSRVSPVAHCQPSPLDSSIDC